MLHLNISTYYIHIYIRKRYIHIIFYYHFIFVENYKVYGIFRWFFSQHFFSFSFFFSILFLPFSGFLSSSPYYFYLIPKCATKTGIHFSCLAFFCFFLLNSFLFSGCQGTLRVLPAENSLYSIYLKMPQRATSWSSSVQSKPQNNIQLLQQQHP